MKRSRFTEARIIGMLKEQKVGARTADICRKYRISAAMFYKLKGKHGGIDVADARWLRALEEENARLRKLLVEQMRGNAILKEAPPTLSGGEASVAPAWRSQTRVGHSAPDAGAGASQYPLWSLDFASDALTGGRRFRVLAVVNDYARECIALVADTSLSGIRLVRELDAIITRRGRPPAIMSDNGIELASMAFLRWCQQTGVEWHYIAPGKLMQNHASRNSS